MAAEDYLDPWDFPSHTFSVNLRPKAKTKAKRNRDIEWTTGTGEIKRLEEMEDSHLLNTIAYINRRVEAHAKVEQLAHARGMAVPDFTINKESADFWTDAMFKELDRRQRKLLKAAKQTIERNSYE
jgi:hypothetical protein